MAARTQTGGPSRIRVVRAVSEELTKFERCEREFRKEGPRPTGKTITDAGRKIRRRRFVRSKAVKSDSWTGRHRTTSLASEPLARRPHILGLKRKGMTRYRSQYRNKN